MTSPKDPAEAAREFAQRLAADGPAAPARVEARIDGRGGMHGLCAVEAVFAQTLPRSAAKELVWLTPMGGQPRDSLTLRAFCDEGRVVAEAFYMLDVADA